MKENRIEIKGDKEGISVIVDIDKFINFDEVISEIINVLSIGKGFYKNSIIKIIANLKNVSDSEIAKLKDKLFEAMDKAGYTWDGETLKNKPQFKPFEKVLVRYSESTKWRCTFYSHFEPNGIYHHNTVSGSYAMCIPFEGNEHLVGTTKNP